MNGEEQKQKVLLASAKSDEAIVYYNAFMPPIEVRLLDGTRLLVPYDKLDDRLEELRLERRERRKHA